MIDIFQNVAKAGQKPFDYQSKAPRNLYSYRPPVQWSEDLRRVLALPRRAQEIDGTERAETLVSYITSKYARTRTIPCLCSHLDPDRHANDGCITRLRLVQALALRELSICSGLLGPIATGHGKTAIDLLAPLALAENGVKLSVLLVPPGLVSQLIGDYEYIGQHFRMPQIIFHGNQYTCTGRGSGVVTLDLDAPVVHVLPYSRLRMAEATAMLERIQPQAIIADEVHKLRSLASATTSRVARYMEAHQSTRFCGWSGSITDKSVADYAHLSAWALRGGSPLPLDPEAVSEWGRALDPSDNPCEPGPLFEFCKPGENVTDGFRRRLVETLGVVTSSTPAVDCGLLIEERKAPAIPAEVKSALDSIRGYVRPDGEELVDALSMSKCAREAACGFYYRWIFPHNVFPRDTALVTEWLNARKEWHKEVREKLRGRTEHMDSPLLVQHAAERAWGDRNANKGLPIWKASTWPRWRDVRSKVRPETESVRLHDYLARDAAAWASNHKGIVWYEHTAFGEWVSEISGLPMYGGGVAGGGLLSEHGHIVEKGDRSVILSIRAHGTGRNGLQYLFSDQHVANPPSTPTGWEQCLDSQTEILTDKGWLGIDSSDWTDAKPAQYDIGTRAVGWAPEFKRVERDLGSEQMWGIQNPHLDIRVTAGHRMVVQAAKHVSRYEVVYSPNEFRNADSMPRVSKIPVAGQQVSNGLDLTDHELTFIGLFLTDGNLDISNDAVSLFQSERYPEIMAAIEKCLNGCGFKYGHSVNSKPSNFGPRRHPLHKWQVSKCYWGRLEPYINKNMPAIFEGISGDQLRILIHAMWLGDGCKTAGTYSYNLHNSQTRSIVTKRKTVADRLQSLCVRNGMRCNITLCKTGLYKLVISDYDVWHVATSASDSRPIWHRLESDPQERVWCVTVPTGAIITRRNGKVAIVGNCLARLHRPGQKASTVRTWLYRHTDEMKNLVDEALRRAAYVEGTLGARQKLRLGFALPQ